MALPILDGNQSATTLSTIIDGGAHIPAHTVVSLGSQAISDITSAVSGSVVSVSNFPSTQTIAGTVTANVLGYDQPNDGFTQIRVQAANENISPTTPVLAVGIANEGGGITANNPLPVSGTVTLSEFVSVESSQERLIGTTGGNTLNAGVGISFNLGGASSIVGTSNPFPISGTVTVGAMPNGALTTRFGSVTTAGTAELTSAVTNTSRKYLLVQNIASATVTIGIGFAPTTTQGIQLSAGGGLTFDAFCPTGAVYWLSSVTGSNWSILEG